MVNVCSYSLFGEREFYYQCVPGIVRAHHHLWKGWELWVHTDSSIQHHRARFACAYADAGLLKLVHVEENFEVCRSMLWRMRPVWMPDVGYVCCRDIDALPCEKDRRMTEIFVQSGCAVHCFNDNQQHTSTMMGGMVSFFAPRTRELLSGFPTWESLMAASTTLGQPSGGHDQILMHHHVWPTVCFEACEHRLHGLVPHPESKVKYTSIDPVPLPDIHPALLGRTDGLIPYLGASGFYVQPVIDCFDTYGEPEITERIKKAESTVEP